MKYLPVEEVDKLPLKEGEEQKQYYASSWTRFGVFLHSNIIYIVTANDVTTSYYGHPLLIDGTTPQDTISHDLFLKALAAATNPAGPATLFKK